MEKEGSDPKTYALWVASVWKQHLESQCPSHMSSGQLADYRNRAVAQIRSGHSTENVGLDQSILD